MRLSRPVALTPGRVPCVEVVVPCYNYGHHLPACIESIVTQPGVSTKVTIVDDASTDDSAEVAERLADANPNIRVLRNESNAGAISTYNRGLRQADSDYVLLLSADDLLAQGALQRAAALMEARPSIGLVYGRTQKFTTHPTLRPTMPAVTWTTWRSEEWVSLWLRRGWGTISNPEAVVRTSVHHEVGYYDPDLPHTADLEMWLRLGAHADVGHINGVDQAHYRRHGASMSSHYSIFADIEERWRAFDHFLSKWHLTDRADQLRPVVQRRLADEALFDLLGLMEHEQVDDVTIVQVLELVRRIDPSVTSRGQWTDVRDHRDGRPVRGLSARYRSAVRSLADVSRWHRWHRFRYFG